MNGWRPEKDFLDSPFMRGLPALRIPGGWTININNLDIDSRPGDGGIGGSSLFMASHQGRRFTIDVMFRPEFDPNGSFIMEVHYWPWPRTERGRRRQDAPLSSLTESRLVHTFKTTSVTDLIEQLQHWIARCSVWTIEGH